MDGALEVAGYRYFTYGVSPGRADTPGRATFARQEAEPADRLASQVLRGDGEWHESWVLYDISFKGELYDVVWREKNEWLAMLLAAQRVDGRYADLGPEELVAAAGVSDDDPPGIPERT